MLAACVPKHVGDGLLDVQLGIGMKRFEHGPDGFGIYLDHAPQALTRRAPDIRVTVPGPPARRLKDRGRMALADLDECRGSHFARLPLVARCQPPELWEYGIGFDSASGEKPLDVLNLRDHFKPDLGFGLTSGGWFGVAELLADPSKSAALTPDQERRLMTELEAVVGQAHHVPPAPALAAPPPAWSEADLLTVDEAAAMLRVSPRWPYRQAATLPFARKLGRKTLRFSCSGLARWLTTRRYDSGAHPR